MRRFVCHECRRSLYWVCVRVLFLCLIIKKILSRSIVAAQPLELMKAKGLAGVDVKTLTREWKLAR